MEIHQKLIAKKYSLLEFSCRFAFESKKSMFNNLSYMLFDILLCLCIPFKLSEIWILQLGVKYDSQQYI